VLKKKFLASLSLSIFLLATPLVVLAEESITITTYYPSPYGVYGELRSQRMAIGDNYIQGGTYDWEATDGDGGEIDYLADLVVEGNVGIGTTAPGYPLHIYSSANQPVRIEDTATSVWLDLTTSAQTWSLGNWGGGTFRIYNRTLATSPFVIDYSSGNVGIGATNPTYQLQLSTDSAAKPSTNTWTIVSDSRIKKDIRPYTNGLEIIKRIRPVWFKYNGKAGFPDDHKENHIGVIAQEVIKVAPYTINTFKAKLNPDDQEETELLSFNSHALTFDLINSVKELDTSIAKLSQENQELKEANKELKSEIENLKTRLSRLEARVK